MTQSVGITAYYAVALGFSVLDGATGAVEDLNQYDDVLQRAGLIILFPTLAVECVINADLRQV